MLHGCTVATNTIVEHKGAEDRAHHDARLSRCARTAPHPRAAPVRAALCQPQPLVPRRLRLEVWNVSAAWRSRHAAQSREREARDRAAERREGQGVAVCLLHSYANPDHERRIGEMLRKAMPAASYRCRSMCCRRWREYERTSTTVINAVHRPAGGSVSALADGAARQGRLKGRLKVMQSSGGNPRGRRGCRPPRADRRMRPPAGVIGAGKLGTAAGYGKHDQLRNGRTTAKCSIIENGKLMMSDEYEVGGGLTASRPGDGRAAAMRSSFR